MSPPEVRMWAVLRRPPFNEHHFRRQVQFGPFYADFASHAARLVVEIDGASHFHDGEMAYDAARDALIVAEGYSVLRFTTSEVMNNLAGVADAILARVTPTRLGSAEPPSPQGGGMFQTRVPKAR